MVIPSDFFPGADSTSALPLCPAPLMAEGNGPTQEQILARVLRHEVADLLQTVYSAVAILQDRFPNEGLERQLLGFLKGRAETCRLELDAAVNLVCPLNLRWTVVDLTALTASMIVPLREQAADRQIDFTTSEPVSLQADSIHLSLTLQLLLRAACQLAARRIQVQVTSVPGSECWPEESPPSSGRIAVWSVQRDGPALSEEQQGWLDRPFTTTRHALSGLGLALARRVADSHGGKVVLDNLVEGGVRLRLLLPVESPLAGH
jgi:signal transduction histidine kinase